MLAQPGSMVWRFHDRNDIWRVSLAPNFVAIETTKYDSRTDFFSRLRDVLSALVKVTEGGPVVQERFGIRYVNRLRDPQIERLSQLVQLEILGLMGASLGEELGFSVCESSFNVGRAHLLTRWGLLPPRATTDPTAHPTAGPKGRGCSDLDMYEAQQPDFDVTAVAECGKGFAETIYAFFRWCVTDDSCARTEGSRCSLIEHIQTDAKAVPYLQGPVPRGRR